MGRQTRKNNPYHPYEDPFAEIRQPPIRYGKPDDRRSPQSQLIGLRSHPIDDNVIEFDRYCAVSAARKLQHKKAKRAMRDVQADIISSGLERSRIQERMTYKEPGPNVLHERHNDESRSSPVKKYANVLGSKVKGAFNKKDFIRLNSKGRSGSEEALLGPSTHTRGGHILEEENVSYWDTLKPFLDWYRQMFAFFSTALIDCVQT